VGLSVAAAIEDLYLARWGAPARRAEFVRGELVVEILKWDQATTGEGVSVYATLGASTKATDPAESHLVEFFLGLSPARDEVASALAGLALYGAQNRTTLDHGHTVPSEQPLWPGTTMHIFLVARPLPDFLEPLLFPDRLHVEFLQAIPIFDSERAYKAEHGVDSLLARWETAQVPFWNPDRAPHP